ncbi:hypothetical protein LIER_25128 [Lithospermum erythrorhizon]|uniref:Uncharacterized protein n=1 Tax=Lithospermum erythrorhizon TaxID=34254 RepID=A0AAV3R3L7_LITER
MIIESSQQGSEYDEFKINILDEILMIGNDAGDNTCIGYERGKFNNQKVEVKFVAAGGKQQSTTAGATRIYMKRTNRIWYYHYYGKK